MYLELKTDILKILSKGESRSSYTLRGINGLDGDDMTNLLKFCDLYEREGEISEPWKEKITRTRVADVLVKYNMW